MKSETNIYEKIASFENIVFAWKKARKGKINKKYVKEFENSLDYNIKKLRYELKSQTYKPGPLKIFILRDPKTRKISKADFRDRIVHHAINNILEPIFSRSFIYDSCANQKGKGTLFALRRFRKFQRKITDNFSKEAFCLKADIKHYFEEIDQKILLRILGRKIKCKKTMNLIDRILKIKNLPGERKGMPLGNLTSQLFANIYLN